MPKDSGHAVFDIPITKSLPYMSSYLTNRFVLRF